MTETGHAPESAVSLRHTPLHLDRLQRYWGKLSAKATALFPHRSPTSPESPPVVEHPPEVSLSNEQPEITTNRKVESAVSNAIEERPLETAEPPLEERIQVAMDTLPPSTQRVLKALMHPPTHRSYELQPIVGNLRFNVTPEVMNVLSLCTQNLARYGFIFSTLETNRELDWSLRNALQTTTIEKKAQIKPEHEGWWLCGKGEGYMKWSCDEQMIANVGDFLLVKGMGRLTALCTRTTTTANGQTFVEGVFYSPVDETTRTQIRQTIDQGDFRTDFQEGEWIMMRGIEKQWLGSQTPEEFLQYAKETMKNTPDHFPDTKTDSRLTFTRKEFREMYSSLPNDSDEGSTKDRRREMFESKRSAA